MTHRDLRLGSTEVIVARQRGHLPSLGAQQIPQDVQLGVEGVRERRGGAQRDSDARGLFWRKEVHHILLSSTSISHQH